MSTLAETMTFLRTGSRSECRPGCSELEPLVGAVRTEFLEMPSLSLTLPQAARLFGVDISRAQRSLRTLLDEGFLVRDHRGAFRRPVLRTSTVDAAVAPPHSAGSCDDASAAPRAARMPGAPHDVLEAMAVELPCLGCDSTYRIPLRRIQQSQRMMTDGCPVRHFADCAPGAFAHLIDPALLADFEQVVEQVGLAAAGAGGRLVSTQ